MANYYLDNGMALQRQREINDASRFGTPNGSHEIHGTVTDYRNGKPSSFWNSSNDVVRYDPYRDTYK